MSCRPSIMQSRHDLNVAGDTGEYYQPQRALIAAVPDDIDRTWNPPQEARSFPRFLFCVLSSHEKLPDLARYQLGSIAGR